MKLKLTLALAAGVAGLALTATPAAARDGCGKGYHRGPYGHCRPNWRDNRYHRGGPVLIVGNYYRGHGYWDGRRYWRERYRDHDRGDWRYR